MSTPAPPTEAAQGGVGARGRGPRPGARSIACAAWGLSIAIMMVSTWRAALVHAPRWPLVGLTFSAAALGVWALGVRAQDRFLAHGRIRDEAARGNLAAALTLAAHQLALAFVTSRALAGTALADLVPGLAFALVGQLTWTLLVGLFRAVTSYDDAEEIIGENHAAAVSWAGVGLALALIIAHALDGPFVSWTHSLWGYLRALGLSLALYPVRLLVVQGLFLGTSVRPSDRTLDHAVGRERRLEIAAVEGLTYVVVAALLTGFA